MSLFRKPVSSHESTTPVPSAQEIELILAEVSRLYRKLFDAVYRGDQPSIDSINTQIKTLKDKLQ